MLKNRFLIIIVSMIIALIGAGAYFTSRATSLHAANNDFVLVWSSNSYLPTGYEGKALPSRGSQISVFILPTGQTSQNPDGLNYRWIRDGQIAGYANGRGKTSFKFVATKWYGEEHEVRVQVLDSQENVTFESTTYIPVVEPEILIKHTDSDYTAPKELYSSLGANLALKAIPLFFSVQKIDELNLNWQLDDQDVASDNVITIKIPTGDKLSEPLQKTISLSATRKTDKLQQASSKTMLIIE